MCFDDSCRDREAETRTAAFELRPAGGMQFHLSELVEFFEYDRVVGGVDADAGIANTDLTEFTCPFHLDGLCVDEDRTSVRGEFDGIDNDVIECFQQEF